MAKKNDNQTQEVAIIDENSLKSKIYIIRGQKVMLDADLALIYGYETKTFNQQVQRNKVKFPSDMMFQLTKEEIESVRSPFVTSPNYDLSRSQNVTSIEKELSRCQNVTSMEQNTNVSRLQNGTSIMQTKGTKGGRVYYPYAFTEQGIYMLMTVLKGELAVKQSLALVRLFKQMKDFIYQESNYNPYYEIELLKNRTGNLETDVKDVKSELIKIIDNFNDPSTYKHFLIMNGKKIDADVAYISIYKKAKKSIFVIDNYISIKTLSLLSYAKKNISISIFSDNKTKNRITKEIIEDFKTQNKDKQIELFFQNGMCHDRYIVIDYNTKNECIYHCGASSKDAGNGTCSIDSILDNQVYHSLIDELLNNDKWLFNSII